MGNKKRSYYTTKLGGKNRTLHFSMNFWSNFTDILDIRLDQIGAVFDGGVKLSTIRTLIYSGLLAYDQEEGNKIDYNEFKVGFWLEDLDSNELDKIVSSMMESRILGNSLNGGIQRRDDDPKKK